MRSVTADRGEPAVQDRVVPLFAADGGAVVPGGGAGAEPRAGTRDQPFQVPVWQDTDPWIEPSGGSSGR